MTLLSTMSATAAGKSYPTSRSDSVSRAALGVMAADLDSDTWATSFIKLIHQGLTWPQELTAWHAETVRNGKQGPIASTSLVAFASRGQESSPSRVDPSTAATLWTA